MRRQRQVGREGVEGVRLDLGICVCARVGGRQGVCLYACSNRAQDGRSVCVCVFVCVCVTPRGCLHSYVCNLILIETHLSPHEEQVKRTHSILREHILIETSFAAGGLALSVSV